MKEPIMKTRAAKAIAIVVALLCAIPAANALAGGGVDAAPPQAGLNATEIVGDGSALGILDRLEKKAANADSDADAGFGATVSQDFEREIGLPPSCRSVRVDETGTVTSCVVDGNSDDALASETRRMQEHGWSAVPLGAVEGATFVKADGSLAWCMVTCTQVGPSTSIVYRSVSR